MKRAKISLDGKSHDILIDGQRCPPGFAIRISIGRAAFHDRDALATFAPQRSTHRFALHPKKWIDTFVSLTCKGEENLRYYRPILIPIAAGTLVGDMSFANAFYWHGRQEDGERYKTSLKPLEAADLAEYRLPELLIPRETSSQDTT